MFGLLYQKGKFYGFFVSSKDNDLSFHQAPILWGSSHSLLQALKRNAPGVLSKNQIRPLNKELNALVHSIPPNDELAKVVLQTIPKEAWERGVFPEDAIKKRFNDVEKLARKLDLVPAEGGSLLIYILSYIQSFLIIKSAVHIPQLELDDQKVNFSQLSTNEILYRGKFWLDRGNLTQALKYVNLLQGASRSVARHWMYEAKILLETQQAANILMTYSAAANLKKNCNLSKHN